MKQYQSWTGLIDLNITKKVWDHLEQWTEQKVKEEEL